jgi:hypothetical protein
MGLFSGIKTATFREGGNYMDKDCSYDLEIHLLRTGTMRPPKKNNFFVADLKVLGTTSTKHKPGDIVNYFCDDGKDNFLGNVKAFMVSAYGSLAGEEVDGESIDEQAVTDALGPPLGDDDKPVPGGVPGTAMRGVRMRVQTVGIMTQVGKPFTVHNWSLVK